MGLLEGIKTIGLMAIGYREFDTGFYKSNIGPRRFKKKGKRKRVRRMRKRRRVRY